MAKIENIERKIFDSTEEALDEFEASIRSGRLYNIYGAVSRDDFWDEVIVAEPIPTRDELKWLMDKPEEEERRLDLGGSFRFPLAELIVSEDPRAAQIAEHVTDAQAFKNSFLFVADGQEIKQPVPTKRKKAA